MDRTVEVGVKILPIEDDEFLTELLTRTLREQTYMLETAAETINSRVPSLSSAIVPIEPYGSVEPQNPDVETAIYRVLKDQSSTPIAFN
ncbi:hypothetical protein [Calothrix sp. PCC 7507]|uniref:hypothetical protein n=1 Tax=Calothrix sp. PCC 7507 TaxID=99598 RepID=UPI0005A9427A|nr:hypothetical protein [Calothrix sp. PCC 7507]